MKNAFLFLAGLIWITVFSGCAHRSFHPWLGQELLVNDDQLAGVWQGDLDVIQNTGPEMDKDIVIIRAVSQTVDPGDGENPTEIPAGYYSITMIRGESLEETAMVEKPFHVQQQLYGGLYKVEDTYIAQLWGSTNEDTNLLLAPLHVIYKVDLMEDEIRLYNLSLEGTESEKIPFDGLVLQEGKDGPHTFFSKTEDMTSFVTKYYKHESFFESEPEMILRRIRDLREAPETGDQEIVEELVPVPE